MSPERFPLKMAPAGIFHPQTRKRRRHPLLIAAPRCLLDQAGWLPPSPGHCMYSQSLRNCPPASGASAHPRPGDGALLGLRLLSSPSAPDYADSEQGSAPLPFKDCMTLGRLLHTFCKTGKGHHPAPTRAASSQDIDIPERGILGSTQMKGPKGEKRH